MISEESPELRQYRMEVTKGALEKLVPEPEDIAKEIPLVGHLAGRRPDIALVHGATVEMELFRSLITNQPAPWEKEGVLSEEDQRMAPAEWFKEHSPSVHGKRANQVVEVAKATQVDARRGGLVGWLFGR